MALIGIAGASPSAALAEEEQASLEANSLSNVRQVTEGFVKAGEGYFSPDGKTIIYQAVTADYPFYQIYTQPLAGGRPHRVSTGRGRTTCAYFHPSGEKILFASSHLDPKLDKTEADERKRLAEEAKSGQRRRYAWDFDPHMDIFEDEPDGKILRRLTNEPGYDAEGAWSADGKLIAFCSDRDGDPDIYLMNADGSNVRQLTDAPGYDGGPFISPDGRWVVFRSDRKEQHLLQLHAVSIDGKQEVVLTDNNGVNWAPYWHGSEPYLIWTGADHSKLAENPRARPNYDLWLMKYRAGEGQFGRGQVWRITDHATADVLPVFSPDGKQLMWTSNRTADGSSQLWIGDFKLPKADSQEKVSTQAAPENIRQRCLEVLRGGLASDEFWPAMHAAEALTLAGFGDEVRRALSPRLPKETDDQRRCGLARELVRAGDTANAEVMLDVLAKADTYGHTHAAESLYKVGQIGDGKLLQAAMRQQELPKLRMMAAAALARSGDTGVLALVRGYLDDSESDNRKIAAWILTRLGNASDIDPLRKNLKRETAAEPRAYVEHALACLGDAEGRQALAKNLAHAEPAVRIYAAEIAGHCGATDLRAQLEKLLADPVLDVRVRAAQSLLLLAQGRERK